VTTTTISREQREYALARVRAEGLERLGDDYRDLRGTYDKLVSIEMIEAVGGKDFGTFFERCARLLRPDGVMALQAITIDDRLYDVEKASRTFIRSHIFPNGSLPSLEVIARSVARRGDLRRRFQRLWRLYLCFCEAGFAERRISNVQVMLAKSRSRGHLAIAEAPAPPAAVAAAQ
jgi:cyclopropane-fatty-acyl-phospholipid synthase